MQALFSPIGLATTPDFLARSWPYFRGQPDAMTAGLSKDHHGWAADAPGIATAARHCLVLASAGSVHGSANTHWRLARKPGKRATGLHWPADAEFAHTSLERGALHAQQSGGSFGPGDAPLRLLERTQDVLALSFFESGNRGA